VPLLALYHIFDAVQGLAVNALRGYQQTLIPTLIYVACLWESAWRWLAAQFLGLHWPSSDWTCRAGRGGMWAAAVVSLVFAGSVSSLICCG
jgi:Na+-driven multidrug efflux pump